MKRTFLGRVAFGLLLSISVFLQSCLDKEDPQPIVPAASVSIYHGSPDVPGVDILIDNKKINTKAFEFSNYTGYINFYTGSRNIKFTPLNAANAFVDTSFTFKQDKIYSLYIVNALANVEAMVVQDSLVVPATGNARIRIVHLSPDAPAIDATLSTETNPLFSDLAYQSASEFKEITSGRYTFNFKETGGSGNILTLPDVVLTSGRIYTVIIRGFATPPSGNTNILSGQVLTNY